MNLEGDEVYDPANEADDRLLHELRQAVLRFDPPPAAILEAAKACLTWRTIDAELAALVFDSAVDQAAAVMRSDAGARLLAFAAQSLSVEVEVYAVGTRRRLVGQLVPHQPARVEVRHQYGITTATADDFGRFTADAINAGPVSLRCHLTTTSSRLAIVTQWISL